VRPSPREGWLRLSYRYLTLLPSSCEIDVSGFLEGSVTLAFRTCTILNSAILDVSGVLAGSVTWGRQRHLGTHSAPETSTMTLLRQCHLGTHSAPCSHRVVATITNTAIIMIQVPRQHLGHRPGGGRARAQAVRAAAARGDGSVSGHCQCES
jgi:hypothetical protein